MKVCHVINSLNRGGAESHLLELVKAQIDEQFIVEIVVIGPDDPNIFSIKKDLLDAGALIYRLNGPRMFNIVSYLKLRKLIKLNEYNVVHSHQPRSDFMVFLTKKFLFNLLGFKWVVSIHGKYDSYLPKDYKKNFKLIFFTLLVKAWEDADSVIVISNEVKTWLNNHTKKISPTVVNYWISKKIVKEKKIYNDITIGFLGRLNKNKGIEDLIQALNQINFPFKFTIGGYGEIQYINFLKSMMNNNLLSVSHFEGYVDNQNKFFEEIDIFVFPSYSEGLGLVLLEAISFNKICITRNVLPMNQFISKHSGYLFNDVEDLKMQIIQASKDIRDSEIKKFKIQELKKILEIYNIDAVFPKILDVYKS